MKAIVQYLKQFWRKDFHWFTYGGAFIFLAVIMALNYYFDFEDDILDKVYYKKWYYALLYFLYYGIAYFFVFGLYYLKRKELSFKFTKRFWLKAIFILTLLAIKAGFVWKNSWNPSGWKWQDVYVYQAILRRLIRVGIYAIGLVLFYKFLETENKTWYGFTRKGFDWKPYFLMLAIMVIPIAWASTLDSFQDVYPKLKPEYVREGYYKWLAVFEPIYLSEFITVEWLFRGFLVVGMVKILGHRAILPATVLYCVFHFGKPFPEALGSIFGGYILGVVAYYSRSIWGGIVVHMGVAALMELMAILARENFGLG